MTKSFTTSSERGTSLSTPPPMRKPNRDAAKALGAAHAKMEAPTQSPSLLHAASATLVASIWLWLWRGVAETTSFHGTTFSQRRRPRRPGGLWRVVQVTRDTCVPLCVLHMPERLRLCWRLLVWPNRHNGGDTPKWCPPRVVRRQTVANHPPQYTIGVRPAGWELQGPCP